MVEGDCYIRKIENNVCTRVTITLEWAQKQFVTRVHTLFYFLHDIMNPWMTIKTTIFTHRPVSHLLDLDSTDDVTIDFWWRHNNETIVMRSRETLISNSLDIDFIHGDIHDRSCKKTPNPTHGNAISLMSLDLTGDKSTLVRVKACCRQATSHYPSQWRPRSMSP